MKIRTTIIAALTGTAGAAGTILVATDHMPLLAGALLGATAIGAPAAAAVSRYRDRIGRESTMLTEQRDQYAAAQATFAGQRERLRTTMQYELDLQRAELARAHASELARARADAYVNGAVDVLRGRRIEIDPAPAPVIDLAAHRTDPALVD